MVVASNIHFCYPPIYSACHSYVEISILQYGGANIMPSPSAAEACNAGIRSRWQVGNNIIEYDCHRDIA